MLKSENSNSRIINSNETKLARLSVMEDGILEIKFKIEEYEVDIEDQDEIENAVLHLTEQGKLSFHILILPGRYNSITKEAREQDTLQSIAYRNQRSMAIVIHSFAQRILANAFFTFKKNRPAFPFKFFDTESEAIQWIKELDCQQRKEK